MTILRNSYRKVLRGGVVFVVSAAHLSQVAVAQQIAPNPGAAAANRPGLSASSGGRSVVNIVAPNAGVSHNRYSSFNVGPNGVILNNSNVDVTARKGGAVRANPSLKTTGPANTIVNEINGAASSLKGDVEVVGTTANVIIANTNGVNCDGCSVTGARNSTLTTGAVSVNGALVGISVFDGITSVGRGGASSDGNLTFSGRHVLVDGQSTANGDLAFFGGSHSIDRVTGNPIPQPISRSRSLPYAVDATAFGAMNGGTIRVIGSEAGLGVRVLGAAKATGGIELRSNGDLFYNNANAGGSFSAQATGAVRQYGSVQAKGTAKVSGRDVFIPGGRALRGDAGAQVSAIQSVTIGGEVTGGNVTVTSGADTNNTGLLIGDVNVTVTAAGNVVNSRDKFTVYEGQAWADAWLKSYQDLFQQWTQSSNPTQVYWGNEYFKWTQTAISDEYLLNGGSIIGGDVNVAAGQSVSNIAGKIAAVRNVSISAGVDFLNTSKATTNRVTAADGCTAAGANCGQRTNFHAAEVLAGGALTIGAGRDLTNTASTIAAYGDVNLNAKGTIRNYALSSSYVSKDFETISDSTVKGQFWGYKTSTQTVTTRADTTQEVDYAPAVVRSLTGSASLAAGADLFVLGSTVSAAKDVNLTAGGAIRLATQAAITTTSGVDTATTSSIWSYGPWSWNLGSWSSSSQFSFRDLQTSPAEIIGNNINISARDIVSTGARIFAANDLTIKATGRLVLDAGEDPLGADTGEIKASLPNVTGLVASLRGGDSSAIVGYRAYLSSDSLADSLVALNGAKGGHQIGEAARKVGAKIDVSTITKTQTTMQLAWALGVYRWRWFSYRYWYQYWQPVITTTQHAKLNIDEGFDTLSEALAGEQAKRGLPSDVVIAATAYDYAVNQASASLDQTTRGIVQAGRDLRIQTGNDAILTGGTIANSGRNALVNAGRDFVLLPLRGTGLADGSDLLERQADFSAGFLWKTPSQAVQITSLTPTALVAGGDMTIGAGRDILNFGASAASAGSMVLAAGRNVQNDAVRTYYTLTAADGCQNWACGMQGHRYKAGEFLAGSGLVVSAGQDIVNTGSSMAAAGSILLSAGRDVQNNAISSQFLINYYHKKKWYGSSTTIIQNQGTVQESNVVSEFGSITAQAGRDLVNIGSVWSAGGEIDLSAKNDMLFDAKTEEMQDVFKKSGFSGFGYSSNKQYWNGFVNAFSKVEGGAVTMAAGRNLTGIGVKLISGADANLSAGNNLTFDAQQNNYFVRSSGWSIGFTAPLFSIAAAALRGDGKAALQEYVNQNPLLASVHQLATGKGFGTLSNTLAVVTAGARLMSQANVQARRPDGSLTGSLASQFNPLQGNALDPFAIYNSGGSNLSAAASNCFPDVTKCAFLVGVSLRFSTWKSEKEWTESTVSRLLVAQDLTISAGRDVALVGGTIASAGRDATIVAGNNLGLAAVADTSRSRSSSWGASIGVQQGGWSIGADASRSAANATVFSNAQVTSGGDATFVAGQDISLIGANVSGRNVSLDAGRDLVLISQQNVSTSNAWSFNVSVTFQGATPTGGSLGGSFSNGARRYTDTPTTVIASERLDAYAGRNTVLAGAGMWSKTGKLRLDTGDLVFDNYQNKDTYVALAGSVSAGINRPWDGSFSAQYRNAQGLTFATLGAGDLNIRNRPRLDLSGLNRDVANMTRVTSSRSWAFALPALNLSKLSEDVKNSGRYLNALLAEVPQQYKADGEQAVKQYQSLLLRGATEAEARRMMATPEYQQMLSERRSWQAAIDNGTKTPLELARIAYLIAQGEEVYFDKADQTYKIKTQCSTSGPSTICGVDINKVQLDKATVAKFIHDALASIEGKPDIRDQTVANAAYRCAMTWVLLAGEGALSQLQLVGDRLRTGSGYSVQIAMIEAVKQYRAHSPDDVVSLDNVPEGLRALMISSSMTELARLRDSWNAGNAPNETVRQEVRHLLSVMVANGANEADKAQAAGILKQYASAGVFQTPYDELLYNVWRVQNPKTAIALDVAMGLGFGFGEVVVKQAALRMSFATTAKQLTVKGSRWIDVDAEASGASWYKNGKPIWPDRDGFVPRTRNEGMTVRGELLDRFGDPNGSFLAPVGTTWAQRSLPGGTSYSQYTKYEVLKPFAVDKGITAPWFGYPGGGEQYQIRASMESLIKNGFLRPVK